MKSLIKIFAIFLVFTPILVRADWYWITVPQNLDTGYFKEQTSPNTIGYTDPNESQLSATETLLPNSFMDTMESANDSEKCNDDLDDAIERLRKFDAAHELYSKKTTSCTGNECKSMDGNYTVEAIEGEKTILSYQIVNEKTIEDRKSLLRNIEDTTLHCLDAEQEEIESAIEEQKRQEAEEARIVEVKKAVSECDFDYFENEMTNDERMDTWDAREACKNKVTEVGIEVVDENITDTEPIRVTPITPVVTYVPTTIPTSEVMKPKEETVKIEPIETQIADTLSEPATTSTETSTTTQEIPKGVEQADIDQEYQPEQQEKPSIFRRIINFFASWFN